MAKISYPNFQIFPDVWPPKECLAPEFNLNKNKCSIDKCNKLSQFPWKEWNTFKTTRVKWLAFIQPQSRILGQHWFIVYLLFYVAFNSQGHIAMGSLQVEETVNHRASASNYQLFNMKRPAQDSNRRPQRLEERTLTATPLSPLGQHWVLKSVNSVLSPTFANRFQGSCFQICVARWVFVVTWCERFTNIKGL